MDIAPSTHSLICSLTATDCSLLNTDIWSVLVMFINSTGLFSLLFSVIVSGLRRCPRSLPVLSAQGGLRYGGEVSVGTAVELSSQV